MRILWLLLFVILGPRLALAQVPQITVDGTIAVTRAATSSTFTGAANISDFSRLTGRPDGVTDFQRLLSRTISPGLASNATVAESYALRTGAGDLAVTLTRGVVAADVAAAAVAVGGAAWAGAQIGAPISKALGNGELTIGDTHCTATYTGWQCDPMQDAGTQPGFVYVTNGYQPSRSITPDASCAVYVGYLSTQSGQGFSPSARQLGSGAYFCDYYVGNSYINGVGIGRFEGQVANTCPAVVDALNPAWSQPSGGLAVADPDGSSTPKCPTGRYGSPSDASVLNRIIKGGKLVGPVLADVLRDTLTKGQPVNSPDVGVLTGPGSLPGTSTTTTTTPPGGSPQTTTTTTNPNFTYGPGPKVTDGTTTTTTAPDGTTTTTGTAAPPPDIKTCGLPGTPPCKIDETGTPTQGDYVSSTAKVQQTQSDAISGIGEAGSASGKSTGWTFTFAFPTACSAFPLPAFAPYIAEVDLCPYKPMIHDLLALVWYAATVWAVIAMVGRAVHTTA